MIPCEMGRLIDGLLENVDNCTGLELTEMIQ